MSWFNTGTPSTAEKNKDGLDYSPDRFWIPTGKSSEAVFVDFLAGYFKEHQVKINGNWKNWITCLGPMMEAGEVAPCCSKAGADSAYSVSMLTVVDCSKWVDKKGQTRQYELKLFPGKYKTAQKLEGKNKRQIDDGKGPMVGKLYRITRETDKSPSVGDDFELIRDVDTAKLFELVSFRGKKLAEHFALAEQDEAYFARLSRVLSIAKDSSGRIPRVIPAFNYLTIFAPKSVQEVRELLNGYVHEARDGGSFGGGGGRGSNGNGHADEQVPF